MSALEDRFLAPNYLDANHDVAEAVSGGRIPSAWSHYVQWGYAENRKGVPEAVREKVRAVMGVALRPPPLRLVSRVHGAPDSGGFEQVGRLAALDLYCAVDAHLQLDRPLRILDFGCGCGRVLPFMAALAPQSTFDGVDIDEEAIGWCRVNFGEAVTSGRFTFAVTPDNPPTAIASGRYDFVYAISVFTHLPEEMQFRWLAELRRVTKPGGILALSKASDGLIRKHLSAEDSRALDEKGFHYYPYGSTEGLPEYYQAAWHSGDYIAREWSKYFRVIEQIPAGIACHQDLVLCERA